MRSEVSFKSDGMQCKGWLFVPDDATGPVPAIVLCDGATGVKELLTGSWAEDFSRKGFAALAFDYRYSGESDGEPRGTIYPHLQLDDVRAALDFLSAHPAVDRSRLALWGASLGGAHVIFLGALDPRVKAIISLVPYLGYRQILEDGKPELLDQVIRWMSAAKTKRNATGVVESIPCVGRPGEVCYLASRPGDKEPNSAFLFMDEHTKHAPNWVNSISLESILRTLEYDPTIFVDAIAPAALLIHHTDKDEFISVTAARRVIERAKEPKRLDVFPGRHSTIYYTQPQRSQAFDIQVEWLREHLG